MRGQGRLGLNVGPGSRRVAARGFVTLIAPKLLEPARAVPRAGRGLRDGPDRGDPRGRPDPPGRLRPRASSAPAIRRSNPSCSAPSARWAYSRRIGDDPGRAVRPWDRDRSGFLVGEGGGGARAGARGPGQGARGVLPYAEFRGGAFGADAYHATNLNPDPANLAGLIGRALDYAERGPFGNRSCQRPRYGHARQ